MKKEKKHPGGRPTSVTPEVVLKLEEAFAIGCNVSQACAYADIARNTFYVFLGKNPKYQDRIDELQERPILKARKTIYDNLQNPETAKWFLERKVSKEFSTKAEIDGSFVVQAMGRVKKNGKVQEYKIGD